MVIRITFFKTPSFFSFVTDQRPLVLKMASKLVDFYSERIEIFSHARKKDFRIGKRNILRIC